MYFDERKMKIMSTANWSSRTSGALWSSRYVFRFVVLLKMFHFVCVGGVRWENDVQLDENFRMLWTIEGGRDATFEVQVRTLGYVGVGFSRDGRMPGADVAVGWIHQGQTYFQDRYVKTDGTDLEPVVDPSQDYTLISGYENATHSVLRFKRKLDTCDTSYDLPISNDTMRVIFMYHEHEPQRGSVIAGNLPNPGAAFRGYRSLFLTQKPHSDASVEASSASATAEGTSPALTMELRNEDVELPAGDDTLYWCKMFKLQDITQKSHVIKYEPVFDSPASIPYMQHIILYECQSASPELELMSREPGRQCYRPNNPPLSCNAIVATWAKGSEGFTFPLQAGYALEAKEARFYLMETHYNNHRMGSRASGVALGIEATSGSNVVDESNRPKADNSGLKLYYTTNLRKHDAGVLSIGMDPNWRHIIPPFHDRVVSEGHCVEGCTKKAFPRQGISIFAVMMRTHLIGKEIKLRHQRNDEEFAPIAHDRNVDPNYQEYRRLPNTVKTMPGDRLIAQCIYDSSKRDQITLGGPTTREESCIVLTYYYPRQKRLTTCHSLPSLPTVLHSLGIQELSIGSNPVLIASPPELAGMTLESRLVTYDWKNQFDQFQQVTRRGSFKAICWDARNAVLPGTEVIEGHNLNITKSWRPSPSQCGSIRSSGQHTKQRPGTTAGMRPGGGAAAGGGGDPGQSDDWDDNHHQRFSNDGEDGPNVDDSINVIEGASRSKVSRSSVSSAAASHTMCPPRLGGGQWLRRSWQLMGVVAMSCVCWSMGSASMWTLKWWL